MNLLDADAHSRLEPMRIGQIVDRAIHLQPKILPHVIIAMLIIATMQAAGTVLALQGEAGAFLIQYVAPAIFNYILYVFIILISSAYWLRGSASMGSVAHRVGPGLIFRLIGLSIWMIVIAGCGFLLFIIPGLVYMINRVLAYPILIVEDISISDALARSKALMTQGAWYSLQSPQMRFSGMLFILFILGMFSSLLVGGVSYLNTSFGIHAALLFLVYLVAMLIAQVVSALANTCYLGFYYDLQARYEGTDLLAGIEKLQFQGANV